MALMVEHEQNDYRRVPRRAEIDVPHTHQRSRITVVMTLEVDHDLWTDAYGPADINVIEDVHTYLGGLIASGDATRRHAITRIVVDGKASRPDHRALES